MVSTLPGEVQQLKLTEVKRYSYCSARAWRLTDRIAKKASFMSKSAKLVVKLLLNTVSISWITKTMSLRLAQVGRAPNFWGDITLNLKAVRIKSFGHKPLEPLT